MDHSSSHTDLLSLLHSRKLKATEIRLQFLELLSNSGKAISTSEVQSYFKATDRVTLYRTIHTMLDKGIIHVAMSEGKETYYALCDQHCSSESHDHNHFHFKCSVCEEIHCIELSADLQIKIPGYQIDHWEVQGRGICQKCSMNAELPS
jgi:Fur family ferric uptake transcriptional regulator